MLFLILFINTLHAEYSYKSKASNVILEEKKEVKQELPKKIQGEIKQRRVASQKIESVQNSNLPAFYTKRVHTIQDDESSFVVLPEKKDAILLQGLRAGDVLFGEIEQSITASPNVPTPLRVRVTKGAFKGAYLLGSGVLDKDLQRVLIDVTRLRLKDRDTPFQLKGQALSMNGNVGLTGEFHSKEGLFFLAEMVSATAAGYMDATIQRSQNQFGTYQSAPTVENAAKLGLVNAASRSADRFAEKERTSPGYTTTDGFQMVQVIITEDPVEVLN